MRTESAPSVTRNDAAAAAPDLPGSPAVLFRVLQLARAGGARIDRLVELVKRDPALTVRVLRTANTSEFGGQRPVVTVERAAALLGREAILSLALSVPIEPAMTPGGELAEPYADWWHRALVQALTAEALASEEAAAAEFYAAGLLMDIGRLVLLRQLGHPAAARRRDDHGPARHLEWPGTDPLRSGLEWLRPMHVPHRLVEAVERHRAPLHELARETGSPLVPALAVAARIGDLLCDTNPAEAWAVLHTVFTTLYRRSTDDLHRLVEQVKTRAAQWHEQLAAATGPLPPPLELVQSAGVELGRLAATQSLGRIHAQLEMAALGHQLEQATQQIVTLQRQALRDPLTGVFNRQFFEETLDKEIRRCSRYASPLGLLFVDVDKFKRLNDTYGHPFGDQVLRRVAACFTEVLRTSDVLARYGGEEFVVLPNAPSESGLTQLAERLRQRIEREELDFEGQRVQVTVSIGCTIALPGRHEPHLGTRLIATADAAMYDAKRQGRNRVCLRSLVAEADARLMQRVVRSTMSRWLVRRDVLDRAVVAQALLRYEPERLPLGELALTRGVLSVDQVQRILEDQQCHGERFGETATRLGLLGIGQVVYLLALQREDPAQIAHILIGQGLLAPDRAAELLDEYLKTVNREFTGTTMK